MPIRKKKPVSSSLVTGVRTRHSEEILWVAEKLSSETLPEKKDAPSDAAWGLYQWSSSDPKHQAQFWTTMYKSLATKEKSEDAASISDDKRKLFRLYEILESQRPELLNDNFPRGDLGRNPPSVPDSAVPAASGPGDCLVASSEGP